MLHLKWNAYRCINLALVLTEQCMCVVHKSVSLHVDVKQTEAVPPQDPS